ncbi:MAG: PadR family transcriptional regulator [Bernardetiaceae bacterium]
MYSKELLKGTLQTIILQLLNEHGQMYGYQITQQVREQSDGKIILTEGGLYPTLHKMEAAGMLQTETVAVGNRTRKYYRLTPQGEQAAAERVSELTEFFRTMRLLLSLKSI